MNNLNFIRANWDSDFFKKEIYTLSSKKENTNPVKANLYWAKVQSYDYQLINQLNKEGFVYIEGELNYIKSLDTPAPESWPLSYASEEDIEELLLLVKGLYQLSRYRLPWFKTYERDLFYATWIKKAVLGQFDDICLISRSSENLIEGFLTLKLQGSGARIGLIGVNKHFRKKNVASKLLKQAEAFSLKEKCTFIEVPTQSSNIAASNLYIRNNYKLSDSHVWLYKN